LFVSVKFKGKRDSVSGKYLVNVRIV